MDAIIGELKEGISSKDERNNHVGGEMSDVEENVAAIVMGSEDYENMCAYAIEEMRKRSSPM